MNIRSDRDRALVILGVAFVVLGTVLLVWVSPPQWGPAAAPWAPTDLFLASEKTLGVNADLSRSSRAERAQALTLMEAIGFRWLRQRFPWDQVEQKAGEYEWAVWDEIVADAVQHGLEIVAVLDGSPTWARREVDADNPLAPPRETRDYGEFVKAFAERYADQIDYYQIWDEPNIAPHWGAQQVDPAAYARLLREAAIQVRAVDSGAIVLLAALAPNVEPGGANMSDLLFLEALYEQGASEWFDVVSTQPYDFGQPVDASPAPDRLNWRRSELLQDIMAAQQDSRTAMWAASFGVTGGDPKAVDEAMTWSRREWPWLGPMFWAAWSPEDAHGEYALTTSQGFAPASDALREWARASTAIAWPGSYPAQHSTGRYLGDWRTTPSGADIGRSGDRLQIWFYGTRLDLAVRRGDYLAFLYVTVDGQPANALPSDGGGRTYVVLYDPLAQPATVTLAQGLADGVHSAEIIAERGWGQWAILGWSVARESAGKTPWAVAAVGGLVLAALGLLIVGVWPQRHLALKPGEALVTRLRAIDDRLVLLMVGLASILVWASVGTLPSLIMLSLLAVLLFLRPETGLPVIVISLPFYQLGKPLLGKTFSMVEILTLLTLVAWLANKLLSLLLQARSRPDAVVGGSPAAADAQAGAPATWTAPKALSGLDWGVLALAGLGALSLVWADQGREAAREYRTVVLEACLFYAVLRVLVRSRSVLWRLVDAWVLGGVLISLVAMAQWILGDNVITADGVWRVRGFYGSPNNLALYLERILPLTVAIGVWDRPSTRKWAYCLAALALTVALVLSYSRGAWLLGVPVSLLFLAAARGRRAFLAAGAIVATILGAMVLTGWGRLAGLLDTAQGTTVLRLQLWRSSLAMLRDHPLLGVGLDNFLYHYRTRYVLPSAWEEFNLSHPHNLVLDFWLRLGLAGVAVLAWLLVAFFRQGWRAYRGLVFADGACRACEPVSLRWLALGLMGGMVATVVHGLVDNAFFLVDLAFVFMLMLALVQSVGSLGQAAGTP